MKVNFANFFLLTSDGEPVFLGLFYLGVVMTALMASTVAFSVYLARTNKTPHAALLAGMRVLEVLWLRLFGLQFLSVFLVPFSCDWTGQVGDSNRMLYLPEKKCFEGTFAAHAGVAAVVGLVHVALYAAFTLKDIDLNVLSLNPMAMGSITAGIRLLALRLFWIFTFHLVIGGDRTAAAALIIIALYWTAYIHVRRLPWLGVKASYIHSATSAMLFAFAVGAAAVDGDATKHDTAAIVMSVLTVVAVAAILGLTYLRRKHVDGVLMKFAALGEDVRDASKRVHRFIDAEELEVLVRAVRPANLVGDVRGLEFNHPSEAHKTGAILVLHHASAQQFPDALEVILAETILCNYVKMDTQQAHSWLEKAKLSKTRSFAHNLMMWQLGTELRRQQEEDSSDTMDWMSYVELQNNLKTLVRLHKRARVAVRAFWRQLLRQDVSVSRLISAFARVEKAETRADANYRAMMERYPRNVKVLRSYARFLDEVQGNPQLAHGYYDEADKMEDALAAAHQEAAMAMGEQGKYASMLSTVDESVDAVVVIAVDGTITFANKNICKMFGYRQIDLEGRNVASLMPAPFSQQHPQYLKNYQTTGKAQVLNSVREVIAMHRDRFVFPIVLAVTKISQQGKDGFMGVIRQVEEDTRYAKVWVARNGMIICGSKGFVDMFGFTYGDVAGKFCEVFIPDEEDRTRVVEQAIENEHNEEGYTTQFKCRHKFGEEFYVKCRTHIGGTANIPLVVMVISRRDAEKPMFTVDTSGSFVYYNQSFQQATGYTTEHLRRVAIMDLLPEPLGALHGSWLKGKEVRGGGQSSCQQGQLIELVHKAGRVLPFKMKMDRSTQADDGSEIITCSLDPLTVEQGRLERQMVLRVDRNGMITAADSAPGAFGYERSALKGRALSDVLRVSGDVAGVLADWAASKGRRFCRVPVVDASGVLRPGVLDATSGSEEGGWNVTVRRLEMTHMTACIDVDSSCKITNCQPLAQHVLGVAQEEILGKQLSEFLVGVCDNDDVQELLNDSAGKRGGLSGKSKAIGPPKTNVALNHADGTPMNCIVQVVEKASATNRWQVLLMPQATHVGAPLIGSGAAPSADALRSSLRQMSSRMMIFGSGDREAPALARDSIKEAAEVSESPSSSARGSATNLPPEVTSRPRVPSRLARGAHLDSRGELGASPITVPPVREDEGDGEDEGALSDDGGGQLSDGSDSETPAAQDAKQRIWRWVDTEGEVAPAAAVEGDVPDAVAAGGEAPSKLTQASIRKVQRAQSKRSTALASQRQLEGAAAAGASKGALLAKVASGVRSVGRQSVGAGSVADGMMSNPLYARSDVNGEDDDAQHVSAEMLKVAAASTFGATVDGMGGMEVAAMEELGNLGDDNSSGGGSDSLKLAMEQQSSDTKFRRFRRLQKIMTSKVIQRPVILLRTTVKIVAVLLLLVHLACFVTMITLMQNQSKVLDNINEGSNVMRLTADISALARQIEAQRSGYALADLDFNRTVSEMRVETAQLAELHVTLYEDVAKAPKKWKTELNRVWLDDPRHVLVMQEAGNPASISNVTTNLWEFGNEFTAAARAVLTLVRQDTAGTTKLENNRGFRLLIENGVQVLAPAYQDMLRVMTAQARDSSELLGIISLAFLGLEVGLLVPLCLVYIYVLMKRFWEHRVLIFSMFVALPRPLVYELANQKVIVEEDSDESDGDDDDVFVVGQQKPKAEEGGKGASLANLKVTKRDLRHVQIMLHARDSAFRVHAADIVRMYAPFVLWGAVVAIILGLTWGLQLQSQDRMVWTNYTALMEFESAKMVFEAQELALAKEGASAAGLSQAVVDARVAAARAALNTSAYSVEEVQTYLQAGNQDVDPPIKDGLLTIDAEMVELQYGSGCLRTSDIDGCANATTNAGAVTLNGLSQLVFGISTRAQLLAGDNVAVLDSKNDRFLFIEHYGFKDLRHGLKQSHEIVGGNHTALQGIITSHVILFVLTILLLTFALLVTGRKHLASSAREARRAARLITDVPKSLGLDDMLAELRDEQAARAKNAFVRRMVRFFRWVFRRNRRDADDDSDDDAMSVASLKKGRKGKKTIKKGRIEKGNGGAASGLQKKIKRID
ncbi:unnamed protein product [Pedinophyceae sp. YPF-701]|nr:unnamed protein product [Pedinophyceae sp. YPF-701]